MNMMNYKEFVKFGYQSKIVPVLAASEDVVQTFRHIARQQQTAPHPYDSPNPLPNLYLKGSKMSTEDVSLLATQKEKMAAQYFDYEGFKAALVRLTIVAGDVLGGQDEA
jgi:hypothetical protein